MRAPEMGRDGKGKFQTGSQSLTLTRLTHQDRFCTCLSCKAHLGTNKGPYCSDCISWNKVIRTLEALTASIPVYPPLPQLRPKGRPLLEALFAHWISPRNATYAPYVPGSIEGGQHGR